MQAIQISKYGDNSLLEQVELPMPEPLPQQVLVELKASAINPVDYKIRSGFMAKMMQKEFPFTLGWEGAGIIRKIGAEVKGFQVGDEVMVMPNFMQGGTYAEYLAVNETEVVPKPQNLSFVEAATIPFSLGTAYTALFLDAAIRPRQLILIHGAGGAVGQMAVQLAKKQGLYVIGTATGANIEELKDLGIDEVVDYKTSDFSKEVSKVDVIIDLVGGETLAKSYPLLNQGGIIVSTTQMPDESALAQYGIQGKMTFTSNHAEAFQQINQWLSEGSLQIKAPQLIRLEKAKEALSLVENRKAKSKIVIEF